MVLYLLGIHLVKLPLLLLKSLMLINRLRCSVLFGDSSMGITSIIIIFFLEEGTCLLSMMQLSLRVQNSTLLLTMS